MKRQTLAIIVLSLLSCNFLTRTLTSAPVEVPTMTEPAVSTPPESVDGIARPYPQHTQYAPGSILPNHRSQEQLDNDVRAFYDYWKSLFVIDAGISANGNQMYRIAFGKDSLGKETTV